MLHKHPNFLTFSSSGTADHERHALARLYEWLLELSRASGETVQTNRFSQSIINAPITTLPSQSPKGTNTHTA